MAYSNIKQPNLYFNTKLYTGNGSTQSINGIGFQPDFCWFKRRDDAFGHRVVDGVRGIYNELSTSSTGAEGTDTNGLTSFDSDGVSIGTGGSYNFSGGNYVLWNWLGANGTSANTDGSISSTVSANTTSGFSIVSYTGTGSDATIGHGLNSAPEMIIQKNTDFAYNWYSWHKDIGIANYIELNTTGAAESTDSAGDSWNNTLPTSSVFSVGSDGGTNRSGDTHLAYCFHSVQGYSKIGSYTGNGSTDGTFVYTGFKPAFVIVKRTDAADGWIMFDNKRSSFNIVDKNVQANSSNAETTSGYLDFTSNGFKLRMNGASANGSGASYIYMCFAEEPLVGDNPATAR